jgi:hypothetical protein
MNRLKRVDDLPRIEPPNDVYKKCTICEHYQESFIKLKQVCQRLIVVHSDICWLRPLLVLGELSTSLILPIIFLVSLGYVLFNPRMKFLENSRNLNY